MSDTLEERLTKEWDLYGAEYNQESALGRQAMYDGTLMRAHNLERDVAQQAEEIARLRDALLKSQLFLDDTRGDPKENIRERIDANDAVLNCSKTRSVENMGAISG
jgi:hypothetical protein